MEWQLRVRMALPGFTTVWWHRRMGLQDNALTRPTYRRGTRTFMHPQRWQITTTRRAQIIAQIPVALRSGPRARLTLA